MVVFVLAKIIGDSLILFQVFHKEVLALDSNFLYFKIDGGANCDIVEDPTFMTLYKDLTYSYYFSW